MSFFVIMCITCLGPVNIVAFMYQCKPVVSSVAQCHQWQLTYLSTACLLPSEAEAKRCLALCADLITAH